MENRDDPSWHCHGRHVQFFLWHDVRSCKYEVFQRTKKLRLSMKWRRERERESLKLFFFHDAREAESRDLQGSVVLRGRAWWHRGGGVGCLAGVLTFSAALAASGGPSSNVRNPVPLAAGILTGVCCLCWQRLHLRHGSDVTLYAGLGAEVKQCRRGFLKPGIFVNGPPFDKSDLFLSKADV